MSVPIASSDTFGQAIGAPVSDINPAIPHMLFSYPLSPIFRVENRVASEDDRSQPMGKRPNFVTCLSLLEQRSSASRFSRKHPIDPYPLQRSAKNTSPDADIDDPPNRKVHLPLAFEHLLDQEPRIARVQ